MIPSIAFTCPSCGARPGRPCRSITPGSSSFVLDFFHIFRGAAQRQKEERRREYDEKRGRTCACGTAATLGRRGVFAIDGDGIAHSMWECYLARLGPQRRRTT